MTLEQEPFTRYHLEKKTDTFTVRVNKEERQFLEDMKKMLNIKSDSKMVKLLSRVGGNVLISNFGAKMLQYLFNPDRLKLSDFEDIDTIMERQNIVKSVTK